MKELKPAPIEMVAVGDIVPYDNNHRKNENAVTYMADAIREFGFEVPMIIDENNVIVCGHTRLLASRQLGLAEVPCIRATDLTPSQIKDFRLVDDNVCDIASWDD